MVYCSPPPLPFSSQYGEFIRFNGHACRHYTVENDTETCRVSFDMR